MVVVDQLSKRAHFIPCNTTCTSEDVAHLFFNHVWKHHGLPTKIISDRDSKFTAKFWSTLWNLLGTKIAMSTAFSPQTDGQTERLNRTLEEYLRAYVDPIANNWSQLLAPAEFAYNSSYHTSIKSTPFLVDCGQTPNTPLLMFARVSMRGNKKSNKILDTLDDFLISMNERWICARDALQMAYESDKLHYDKAHRFEEFEVGEEVFLTTQRLMKFGKVHYASQYPSSKFEPRY
jgi:hypothetical protein